MESSRDGMTELSEQLSSSEVKLQIETTVHEVLLGCVKEGRWRWRVEGGGFGDLELETRLAKAQLPHSCLARVVTCTDRARLTHRRSELRISWNEANELLLTASSSVPR